MPGGDRTGPMGMGPMTGRAAGFCAGFGMPGYANAAAGRGFGMGYGRGRGMGFRGRWAAAVAPGIAGIPAWGAAMPSREQQREALKSQVEYLEGALGDLRAQMKELEAKKAE